MSQRFGNCKPLCTPRTWRGGPRLSSKSEHCSQWKDNTKAFPCKTGSSPHLHSGLQGQKTKVKFQPFLAEVMLGLTREERHYHKGAVRIS